MRSISFWVFLILITSPIFSSERILSNREAELYNPSASMVRFNSQSDLPSYFKFKADIELDFEGWKSFMHSNFDLNENLDFYISSEEIDELGMKHYRLKQKYKEITIEESDLIVHELKGRIVSFNGAFFNNITSSTIPSIEESIALSVCLKEINAKIYKWQIQDEEIQLKKELDKESASYFPNGVLVYIKSNIEKDNSIHLAFKFNIYAQEPLSRYEYFVDAHNGDVLFVESQIHTGNSPGKGVSAYSDTVDITTDSLPNVFRLRETTRGNGIETYDLNSSTQYSNAADLLDSNNFWDTFNRSINRYAIDAHWGTEKTYDYFLNVHNRNSIDDQGFALRSYVHYGTNYVNAFWDGQRMTYGDGDNSFTPLTTLDITGHEIAHGWTDRTSDLIYRKESGALNESFSDIWGVVIENYARPNNWNWLIGEDIGGAFRSMENPKLYGDPDTYGGVNWVSQNCTPTSGNDWCGVHSNSGVQNFWFYLLAQGGNGVNDNGDTFSVAGLGLTDASKVAYRNNTIYLGRNSNYSDARFYAIQSAVDLFGACSPEVESVTNAWYAVGVGRQYENFVNGEFYSVFDTLYCNSPATVEFQSIGSNVLTFSWNFGDGNTSSLPNPVNTYTNLGSYDVQLIADGGVCGIDTVVKSTYIKVDSNYSCSIFMDGTTIVSNECSGVLYDNGGLSLNYGRNRRDTLIIAPLNGDFIVLKFEDLRIESGDLSLCNRDYIDVFDGGLNSQHIGRYCSNNLPPDSIVSTSDSLSIVFYSDDKVEDNGFKVGWECQVSQIRPIADFTISTDSSCNGIISFKDASLGGNSSWGWNFGDGNVSFERNPTHQYMQSGSYDVSLVVSNSIASSFIRKTRAVNVNFLTSPVAVNDTACIGDPSILSASAANTINWYSSINSDQPFYKGDSLFIDSLISDRNYFVENYKQGSKYIGTPISIPGNGYFSAVSEEIYFDVHEKSILEQVILNSNRIGDRTITLRNSKGEVLESKSIYVSNSFSLVDLNFEIFPDTAYSLSVSSRDPGLYVNATGANYPYPIGNLMTLTGSSLGSNGYPFFYYWTVKAADCWSQREAISAIVDTSCISVGLNQNELLFEEIEFYPNPVVDKVYFKNIPFSENLEIAVFELNGREILRKNSINSTNGNAELDLVSLPSGFYFVKINSNTATKVFKIIKTD